MASANQLDIVVHGFGGHAAMPHRVRDPIVAASEIVLMAQTIVSRAIDPIEHAVLSITSIHGGEAYNVIPNKVEMRVGFRTFSETVAEEIETELRRICAGVAAAHGITVAVSLPDQIVPYPPTINHPAETEIALAAMRGVAGEANVKDDLKPAMGSEDFSFMLRLAPGAYVLIGNGDSAPLHHPAYDFNDAAIPHGVAYWAELARRVLPR